MSNQEKFDLCLEQAKRIVDAYREEAPEGCDPQNSGIALATLVIGAGTAAYQASQTKKAAATAASERAKVAEGTKGYDPVTAKLGDAQADYTANIGDPGARAGAAAFTSGNNKFNTLQAQRWYTQMQPYFMKLQSQVGKNALSFAQGELPEDTVQSIGRASAQRGIQGGFGFGSQGGRSGMLGNLNLRNLGLTSLDLTKFGTNLGMSVNMGAKQLSPQLMQIQENFMTPAQAIVNKMANATTQNQGAIANASLANNLLKSEADAASIAAQTEALQNQKYMEQLQANAVPAAQAIQNYYATNTTPVGGTNQYGAVRQPNLSGQTVYRPALA